jgi:hypothetical protein
MFRELNFEDVDWIDLAQDIPQNWVVVKSIMNRRATYLAAYS